MGQPTVHNKEQKSHVVEHPVAELQHLREGVEPAVEHPVEHEEHEDPPSEDGHRQRAHEVDQRDGLDPYLVEGVHDEVGARDVRAHDAAQHLQEVPRHVAPANVRRPGIRNIGIIVANH